MSTLNTKSELKAAVFSEQQNELYGSLNADCTIAEVDAGWVRFFGLSAEALSGCSWLSFLHHEDTVQAMSHLEKAWQLQDEVRFKARVRLPNGEEHPVLWAVAPQLHLGTWSIRGWRAPETFESGSWLQTSPEFFSEVLEQVIDPFFLFEQSGRIVECNQAACEALKIERNELMRLSVEAIEETLTPSRFLQLWGQLRPGERMIREGELKRRDGTSFPVEMRFVRLHSMQPPVVLMMSRDISEKQRRERMWKHLHQELREARDEALAANRTKSTFLANMSHELRTPLNAIIGYAEILDEELEDMGEDELSEDAKKIQKASRHLLSLINDLLDISKIEAGRFEFEEEVFAVQELFDEVYYLMEPLFEKSGNVFEMELDESLVEMTADRKQLRQILINLLSNANKFTEQGEISMRGWRYSAGGVDWVGISVRDTGIGISDEKIEKLFQPFSQANRSIRAKYGGTGLGLSISRKMCQAMGGDITVQSKPGVGSLFTVRLPATPRLTSVKGDCADSLGALQGLSGAFLPAVEEVASPELTRILIVEIDPSLAVRCGQLFSQRGIETRIASDISQAMAFANAFLPDVTILSETFPQRSQLLRKLRSSPQHARMVIIEHIPPDLDELYEEVARIVGIK